MLKLDKEGLLCCAISTKPLRVEGLLHFYLNFQRFNVFTNVGGHSKIVES